MSGGATRRAWLAAAALALAGPALAYVPPPASILARAAQRRDAMGLASLEVDGTLELRGGPATPFAPPPGPDGLVAGPARLLLKAPGRARLEQAFPDVAPASRPFATLRDGRLSGAGGLAEAPPVAALLRALGALLATPGGPGGARLGQALEARGVKLDEASLGRVGGRPAWALGGPATSPRPLAFFDKEGGLPVRLLAVEGGTLLDVRLLDWGSATGGDWFPRLVEVWRGPELLLRLTTGKATANPKLADALF